MNADKTATKVLSKENSATAKEKPMAMVQGFISEPPPGGVELIHRGSQIDIVRTWFESGTVLLTLGAVIWDGFLLFWYFAAIGRGEIGAMLFPVLHVAWGIFLTYAAVAHWFNRTHILVSHEKIAVRHGPVPWWGNTQLQVSDLHRVYVKERADSEGGISYDVRSMTRTGGDLKLVGGLAS